MTVIWAVGDATMDEWICLGVLWGFVALAVGSLLWRA